MAARHGAPAPGPPSPAAWWRGHGLRRGATSPRPRQPASPGAAPSAPGVPDLVPVLAVAAWRGPGSPARGRGAPFPRRPRAAPLPALGAWPRAVQPRWLADAAVRVLAVAARPRPARHDALPAQPPCPPSARGPARSGPGGSPARRSASSPWRLGLAPLGAAPSPRSSPGRGAARFAGHGGSAPPALACPAPAQRGPGPVWLRIARPWRLSAPSRRCAAVAPPSPGDPAQPPCQPSARGPARSGPGGSPARRSASSSWWLGLAPLGAAPSPRSSPGRGATRFAGHGGSAPPALACPALRSAAPARRGRGAPT
eukprot:XP_020399881.1 uncharacterized protein LOC109942356 [Zea mays]